MKTAVIRQDCCNYCEYYNQAEAIGECTYNEKVNESPFTIIFIPNKYLCSCKHYKEKITNNV